MASNKPTNRKARKAAEAAQAKAQAEQEAKDRRTQTIIGVIVVAVIVVLAAVIGVTVWRSTHPKQDASKLQEAWSKVEQASPKPANTTEKGGFLLSKNGINKPVEDAPTVAVYMDFMCPGCGAMERQMGSTYGKLIQAGQINLEVHLMAFMDQYSTDEYSPRAANAAIEIAEAEPEHLQQFVTLMYAEDFQPDETNYEPVSNEQIKQRAIKAGVSEEVATKATDDDHTYGDWLKAISDYTPLREDLWNTSGQLKGQMSTPTITINGHFWDRNYIPNDVDLPTAFLKAIGLDASAVGQEGTMPSVGTDKAGLYPES